MSQTPSNFRGSVNSQFFYISLDLIFANRSKRTRYHSKNLNQDIIKNVTEHEIRKYRTYRFSIARKIPDAKISDT